MSKTAQHHGLVGECTGCGGRMIEGARVFGDERGTIQLLCEDCDADGRVEYRVGEEQPWQDPSVQEGVTATTVKEIRWVDCPRCDGHGWVADPLCDLRRAMNGREHPCSDCHTIGTVPRVVETDGGLDLETRIERLEREVFDDEEDDR